jgi:hypothetical protein
MTYEQLVRAVRDALRKKTPVVHAPPAAVAVLSRALSVVVRDVVFTADEIRGLTAGLLVSHQRALGRVSFLEGSRRKPRRSAAHTQTSSTDNYRARR